MEFVVLAILSAVVKKVVDFVKYALNADVNALVTQVVAWLTGIGTAFVAANSDFGSTLMVNDVALSSLNNWSLVLVGFNLASVAGVGWDAIKAVDNSDSASVPALLGRSGPVNTRTETHTVNE